MTEVAILFDKGKTGTLNQCIAVAKAMGCKYKIFAAQGPVRLMPFITIDPGMERHRILIAGGRIATYAAAKIKKKTGCKVIAVMNPRMNLSKFDLIIAPKHDNIHGDNVVHTIGSLSPFDAQDLVKNREKHDDRWIAVFLGGPTRHFSMSDTWIRKLIDDISKIQKYGRVMITASRRTHANVLQAIESAFPDIYLWNFQDTENPYKKMLASADIIIITQDSISMISESFISDARVYIYPLDGHSNKFDLFYKDIYKNGLAKPFSFPLEEWIKNPFDQNQKIRDVILYSDIMTDN